jgi:hypothetical protein
VVPWELGYQYRNEEQTMRGTLSRNTRSRMRVGVVISVMAALMVAASIATVQAANPAKRNICPPASLPGAVINGGLEVVGQCVLTGVTINGGVQIDSKGHLTLYASTVNGRTDVKPDGEFDSNFPEKGQPNNLNGGVTSTKSIDMDIHGGTINGNVVFAGMTPGNAAIVSFCGVHLRGSLTLENFLPGPFARFPNGAQIGDSDANPDYAAPCTPNTISGSVQIRNNDPAARIELETNTIGGSVQITDSNPSVTGNMIGGSLQCHEGATLGHWDADDTNTNNVHGSNSCIGSSKSRNDPAAGVQHGTNTGPHSGQPNGNSSVMVSPAGGTTQTHKNTGKGKKK